jgi:sec-independent protein translocase protein TatA
MPRRHATLGPREEIKTAMGSIGTQELIIILIIVLLLFGAKRIPEIARSMGQGIREFKKATKDITHEVNSSIQNPDDERDKTNKPGS